MLRFIVSIATLFLVGIVARHAWLIATSGDLTLGVLFMIATAGAIAVELGWWITAIVQRKQFGAMHVIDGFFSLIVVGCAAAALARYAGYPLFTMTPILQGVTTTALAVVLGFKIVTAVLRGLGMIVLASAPIDGKMTASTLEATV